MFTASMFHCWPKMPRLVFLLLFVAIWGGIESASVDATEYTTVLQLKNGKVRGTLLEVGNGKKIEFYQALKYGML